MSMQMTEGAVVSVVTSAAVVKLLDMCQKGCGLIYEPVHVRRMARANADALEIAESGKHRITEIQERGLRRLIAKAEREQANLEAILDKAIPQIGTGAKPEEVDPDFLASLLNEGANVSREEMQQLLAKVLAGEVNKPGRFSRRTVRILAEMTKNDVQDFTRLLAFGVGMPGFCVGTLRNPNFLALVYDVTARIYAENGVSYTRLRHLESLGLLRFSMGEMYFSCGELLEFENDKVAVTVQVAPSANGRFEMGHVDLTMFGDELSTVVEHGSEVPGLILYWKGVWEAMGHRVVMAEKPGSSTNTPPPTPA